MIKKAGVSTLTSLHIAGEANYMTDIPSHLFDSNLAWFCKNETDLLKFFNKNFPFPNQASWILFSSSNTASMKFISVLQMQHFEMGEWLHLKKAGKMLERLVFLYQTFGSGALATGCYIPVTSSVPHRLCSLRTLGPLWLGKKVAIETVFGAL